MQNAYIEKSGFFDGGINLAMYPVSAFVIKQSYH
jgi:hypothetical protein